MHDHLSTLLRLSALFARQWRDRLRRLRGVGPADVAPAPEEEEFDPWELWQETGGEG